MKRKILLAGILAFAASTAFSQIMPWENRTITARLRVEKCDAETGNIITKLT